MSSGETPDYWVALCLGNGIVAQGESQSQAISKLREAILSVEDARREEPAIDVKPVAIKELHEFLTIPGTQPITEPFELRAALIPQPSSYRRTGTFVNYKAHQLISTPSGTMAVFCTVVSSLFQDLPRSFPAAISLVEI
ncbi:hypothetical protein [Desulforudis sp. DRI-14]|uniref:hypothetical protein n=1 Tax=Desulforudis sp. DRI-14 TaxID=3459793 RepID=UPI0040436C82